MEITFKSDVKILMSDSLKVKYGKVTDKGYYIATKSVDPE
jgi:hypothetical protein